MTREERIRKIEEMKKEHENFLKSVTKKASDFARDRAEDRYYDGKDSDFDLLFQEFLEEVLNDAMIEGIEDGMERWEAQRPLTEQELRDREADERYTRQKEERCR